MAALAGPAQRLTQLSADLAMAASGAAAAAGSGRSAAGDPAVAGAADVFRAGVQSLLGALGDDAGLLGEKVQAAGITYDVVDGTAVRSGP